VRLHGALSWLRRLFVLSLQRYGFIPRLVNVGLVVVNLYWDRFISECPDFSFFMFGHSMPHTHLFHYDRHSITLVLTVSLKKGNKLFTADFRKNRITMFLIQEFQGLFPVPRILLHLWLFASGTCYDFGKKSLGCSCEQLLHASVVMINKSIIT
jgi:hypothetical protein